MNNIYIGYDAREARAYKACVASLVDMSRDIMVQPINHRFLGNLYTRQHERRGGQVYDVISQAPMATEFSLARFWTPYMDGRSEGWVLFCDCDFMFREDVNRLFDLADDRYAVMVVKHEQQVTEDTKMDGQAQTRYGRKNWSSLMLFNLAHPKNRRLEPSLLNAVPGIWLHQFMWLDDDDIGELPLEWNYLVGVSPPIARYIKVAHFTLGTPDMPGYETLGGELADEWRAYAGR